MKRRSKAITVLLLLVACGSSLKGEEPRHFRWDHGVAAHDNLAFPDRFDDSSQLAWRVPLAPGHSTPCVCGDGIYLTTFDDGKLFTVALDRGTGAVRWRRQAPNTKLESFHFTGSPAAATVACDGQRVYAFFGSYGLLCYDLKGELVWSKELGPFQDEFGSASSPVLYDGKLLLAEDHDAGSYLLCVNAADGTTLWQTPREGLRSYSTPVVWSHNGRKSVVVAGALLLTAYDLDSGKPLWQIEGLARIVNTMPTPKDNRLFVATWAPGADKEGRIRMEAWPAAAKKWDSNRDGRISRDETDNKDVLDRFFRIDTNQDQGLDEREWTTYSRVFDRAQNSVMALETDDPRTAPKTLWQYDRGIPYVPSPLVYRDVVYVVKDGGIVTSLDPATGAVLKQARVTGSGSYYASPVGGDGKVYLLSEQGVFNVLAAQGKWAVLSSHDFGERSLATPVLDAGQILIRTEAALYCFAKKR